MGFSLDDLSCVLRQRDAGGAPCRQVHAIAASRLEELGARITGLQQLRWELRRVLHEWGDRLAALPAGQRAGLLDALSSAGASADASSFHGAKARKSVTRYARQVRRGARCSCDADVANRLSRARSARAAYVSGAR